MAASHLPHHCHPQLRHLRWTWGTQASGCPLWEPLECIAWRAPLSPSTALQVFDFDSLHPHSESLSSPHPQGFPPQGLEVCMMPIAL